MVKVSAILLGAGESKRMGANKLSLPWGEKTVLEHCLEVPPPVKRQRGGPRSQ